MVGLLRGAKFRERFLRCIIEIALRRAYWIAKLPARETAEIRRRGKEQNHFVSLFDCELVTIRLHGTAERLHSQPGRIAYTLAPTAVVQRAGHQQFAII